MLNYCRLAALGRLRRDAEKSLCLRAVRPRVSKKRTSDSFHRVMRLLESNYQCLCKHVSAYNQLKQGGIIGWWKKFLETNPGHNGVNLKGLGRRPNGLIAGLAQFRQPNL